MLRLVVDTNLWIRALLGGQITLPILEAWKACKYTLVISQDPIAELDEVWRRPRLVKRINTEDAERLLEQMQVRGEWVNPTTVPPRCRDPKDHPVLAAASDGHADVILTGDADLRADDLLRAVPLTCVDGAVS